MNNREFLASLTDDELIRIHHRIWDQIDYINEYQPFGYDWPTLRIIHPHFTEVLREIIAIVSSRNVDRATPGQK